MKKLTLSRETLYEIDAVLLRQVVAGDPPETRRNCGTNFTCGTCDTCASCLTYISCYPEDCAS